MESEYKYYAFISYKREDEKLAKWLQNKLETYKLPTSLAKETGKEFPKTFYPCFRDKTDLSETGDLSQILHDKLQKSQYLIVVCSPRSAQSKWVNKEVETFQKMGRADKIIPFIIEGSPDTSNPKVHCYPTTLDENILGISIPELGKEKAVVKTIAAMLNINFDTLWNRQRERVMKRKIKIAVLSAIIIAIFGGFSIYQALKINEQYKRAEKLINAFYFYDGKFALAYNHNFYFIDKNGDEVKKLGRWDKAEQFDFRTGYAKVTDREGLVYLLDTLENTFRYSDNINIINNRGNEDNAIQILNIRDQDLSKHAVHRAPFLHGNDIYTQKELTRFFEMYDMLDIRELSEDVWKLTNLRELNLNYTYINNIPPKIGELTKLTKLNLSYNSIDNLPPEIGKLINLTELKLSYNRLTSLPPEIGNLKNLEELDLSHNEEINNSFMLKSLPREIGNLVNLKELKLSGNKIKSLPQEIGNLTNLTLLDLSDNELTSLPPEIGKLTNLKELKLYGNKITSLPPEIENLTNLYHIDIECDNLDSSSNVMVDKINETYWADYERAFGRDNDDKIVVFILIFLSVITIIGIVLIIAGFRFHRKKRHLYKWICWGIGTIILFFIVYNISPYFYFLFQKNFKTQ